MEYPGYEGGSTFLLNYTHIVIDMIDDYGTFNNTGFTDNRDLIAGYSIVQIRDALIGAHSANSWKNNIKNNYKNNTEQHWDALFDAWGF